MSVLQSLAEEAAQRFSGLVSPNNTAAAFDSGTIMIFAEILVQLIEAFQECRESSGGALNRIKNPGFVERVILRQRVRDQLGRKEFRKNGREVMAAIMETGEGLSENDIEELYREV